MPPENFRPLIRPMETVHRIIWLAYIAAVPVAVCVVYVLLGRTAPRFPPPPLIALAIPLAIISLVSAVLAPYVSNLLLPESRLRELINRQPVATPDEQRLGAIAPNFFVAFIVRLAFNESIVMYGLVLAFISRTFIAILPFAIVSLALNLTLPFPLDLARQRAASLGLLQEEVPTQPR
jgi:hypothetical protein